MPIRNERFYATLGLAMRAGQLILGEEAAVKSLSGEKIAFLLLDGGASRNAKKMAEDACRYRGVPLYETEAGRLGDATGKSGRMCAAVRGGPLAERLMRYLEEDPPGQSGPPATG